MPTPPQIKENARWVIENFGPQSGLLQFGYDARSIAYLDTFIDRQGESFRANEQSADRIVSLLGAFVGEAIIANYGGEWQQSDRGLSIAVPGGGQVHFVQPFHKVHKRLTNGKDDSLYFYFATFLPEVFSKQPTVPPMSQKKPWWRIFG